MWLTVKCATLVLLGVLAAGCASATSVPVRGSPDACAALVGEWGGTYTGRDRDSSGTIWFRLLAGEDHAHGDVVMTRTGAPRGYDRFEPTKRPDPPAPPVLAIRFVHAEDGTIDGMLEPYWDPQCRCEVVTVFHGRQQGDRLSGSFTSRRDGIDSHGRWQMKRRAGSSNPDGR